MKTIKSSWKVCVAAIVGFGLGATFFHVPTAKAQSGNARVTSVYKLDMNSAKKPFIGPVVGFSCVASTNGDGDAVCYVVTQ
jgi:hypothetical protein